MSARPALELVFVGFGHVARRAAALLASLEPELPCTFVTRAILTARHGATVDMPATEAADRLARGESLSGWPRSLPAPARAGESNAAAIAALGERHKRAGHDGRLVCIETTLLDIHAGEPACSHVSAALDTGMHVVTANKGPVAFAYHELAILARAAHRQFRFEGAVMDGVPVFNLARETLPAIRIEGFRGVVNSTTNHILTCLERGEPFDAALEQMQRDGIAEADPSLDIDGWDAAAKTAALMNVLMDAHVTPHAVAREGIRHVSQADLLAALAQDERLRLIASAERTGGGVQGRVRLERLPAADPLGSLQGQQNALLLSTDVLGEIGILQRTGGLTPTAYALVSDLASVARAPR